jgi:hypothetical protein
MAFDIGEVAYKLAKKKINKNNQLDGEEFFFILSLIGENDFNKSAMILKGFQDRGIDIFFRNIHEDLYRRYKMMEGNLKLQELLGEKSEHIKQIINLTNDTSKWQNRLKEVEQRPTEEE